MTLIIQIRMSENLRALKIIDKVCFYLLYSTFHMTIKQLANMYLTAILQVLQVIKLESTFPDIDLNTTKYQYYTHSSQSSVYIQYILQHTVAMGQQGLVTLGHLWAVANSILGQWLQQSPATPTFLFWRTRPYAHEAQHFTGQTIVIHQIQGKPGQFSPTELLTKILHL